MQAVEADIKFNYESKIKY